MSLEVKKITHLKWRQFLDTEAGKEGVAWLHEMQPSIPKGQPHEVQYDGAFSEGYRYCLSKITNLLAVEPESNADKNLENP